MQTLKKVADQVPEIMAQHVLEGQVGVFLAALYQLICTQQQGVTSMVVVKGYFVGVWCMVDFFDEYVCRCTGNPLLTYS